MLVVPAEEWPMFDGIDGGLKYVEDTLKAVTVIATAQVKAADNFLPETVLLTSGAVVVGWDSASLTCTADFRQLDGDALRPDLGVDHLTLQSEGKYRVVHVGDVGLDGENRPTETRHDNPENTRLGKGHHGNHKRGRRRRGRSMGRFPFVEASQSYLDFIRPYVAEETFNVRERGYRYLAEVFNGLHEKGLTDSTNPAKFTEKEIGAFVAWMRENEFGLTYQHKLLNVLVGNLLGYIGNPVLERMKAARFVRLPRRVEPIVFAKDDAWFTDTMRKLDAMQGWRAEAVKFATAFYYHTGVRVKELRLADLADLDTEQWTFTIGHPKGEGAWSSPGEKISIFPSLRPFVLDFLDARTKRFRDLGFEDVKALIANAYGKHYSDAGWRELRLKTFREAGVDRTSYRVLRPSFAQKLKDNGAEIEAVSRALRHSSVATTERFYARIRTKAAWDRLEEVWERPRVKVEVNGI